MAPPNPFDLRIIIPVLDDAEVLSKTLAHLAAHWPAGQILVVDGGSEDASSAVARAAGVALVETGENGRGRARQMNEGARLAGGKVLVFLHADTRLPPTAADAVCKAIAEGHVGGAFSRRFESPSLFLRFSARLSDLRGRAWGLFLGDQAIFDRRDIFETLGGYPEIPVCEDLEFSRRLGSLGTTTLLKLQVLSSARRFQKHGVVRTTWRDLWIAVRHLWRSSKV